MFLSHPPMVITPSIPSQPTTVSIESAITSLLTREYFIPSVPMEIPSEIVIVLKITAFPPAASTPLADSRASRSICMLQGVTWLHVEATPTRGLLKSSLLKPTGYSIARLGALSGPSNTFEENFLLWSSLTGGDSSRPSTGVKRGGARPGKTQLALFGTSETAPRLSRTPESVIQGRWNHKNGLQPFPNAEEQSCSCLSFSSGISPRQSNVQSPCPRRGPHQ